jgi:GTPase involved in cell partitioning and DNA repair
MVLKRLFEAEDEAEITRDERVSLSRSYESELKNLSEELKQSELIVTLNELESIRDDILQKFEATLNSTQSRIDTIMKELKLEEKKTTPPPGRRRTPERVEEAPEVTADEGDGEEEPRAPRPRSDVEAKLYQLRMEVLKELEELEKLELEV